MTYGLPYMGSKNSIAERIVAFLPRGRRFCDLSAAMPRFFLDAAAGRYLDERRWISREDFARLWPSDPFVLLCWSFGGGKSPPTYLYGRDIEAWMRALHHALVLRDFGPLAEDFSVRLDGRDVARLTALPEADAVEALQALLPISMLEPMLARSAGRTLKMEHRVRLARVNALARLALRGRDLTAEAGDYREYRYAEGDVVYCDPPYIGTERYTTSAFDHPAFYEWLRTRSFPVYVSEYRMPEDFVPVWAARKRQLLAAVNCKWIVEKVFVHRRWASAARFPARF